MNTVRTKVQGIRRVVRRPSHLQVVSDHHIIALPVVPLTLSSSLTLSIANDFLIFANLVDWLGTRVQNRFVSAHLGQRCNTIYTNCATRGPSAWFSSHPPSLRIFGNTVVDAAGRFHASRGVISLRRGGCYKAHALNQWPPTFGYMPAYSHIMDPRNSRQTIRHTQEKSPSSGFSYSRQTF